MGFFFNAGVSGYCTSCIVVGLTVAEVIVIVITAVILGWASIATGGTLPLCTLSLSSCG